MCLGLRLAGSLGFELVQRWPSLNAKTARRGGGVKGGAAAEGPLMPPSTASPCSGDGHSLFAYWLVPACRLTAGVGDAGAWPRSRADRCETSRSSRLASFVLSSV